MAPRSVADATRFTSTGPYAFTPSPSPAGGGGAVLKGVAETPQQRVTRLRAAARAAKAEAVQGTLMDRVVDRGRSWADRAHRVTALGLIGATVLCSAITVYAITDMIIYNRRRKAERTTQLKQTPNELDAIVATDPKTHTTTASEASPLPSPLPPPPPPKEHVGAWERLKSWAMSGMTPADQEYKTVFEKARDEERKGAGRLLMPMAVEASKEGRDRNDRIDSLGADDLAKGEREKDASAGTPAGLTGWWTGR